MKTKELALTSLFIALLIAQNYILFNFPLTLTYAILYFLAKKLESKNLPFLAVLAFVIIKNIITPALPTTIIADLIGLSLFILICKIPSKWLNYVTIPFVIVFHVLLMDFSTAILVANPLKVFLANIGYGFIAYIYAPLSIIIIVLIDGIEVLTNYEINETR
ncbi:MAG: hypothetical protein GX149_03435 [Acholeplasmataceae bacterium]|jgi:hypothetical protein|nr:hypothetical protein [Acholeplasmataceae bacterium]